MKKGLLGISVAAMMLLGVGCTPITVPAPQAPRVPPSVMPTPTAMQEKRVDSDPSTSSGKQMEPVMATGAYKAYSTEAVASEQKLGQKVVLFFHAQWCPYCRVADAAFLEKNDKIPAGVTVLKLDYDTQTALKEKYGVNYQHTFVQIDSSGNMVSKWVSGDIDNLVKNIK